MRAESSCTVFKFNGKGFDRCFVSSCHWQENKAKNVLKSGDQNADSVTVYIPADYSVITPDEIYVPSDSLLANADIAPQIASKDIIVKGKCNIVFDNSNDKTVSESLKKLRSEYQFYTVMSIDRKLYGSKNLQHIKISAR
jgi:hypothetical protein